MKTLTAESAEVAEIYYQRKFKSKISKPDKEMVIEFEFYISAFSACSAVIFF